ncbi:CrcB family protein [Myxococcota bacterium]|nr:CrcB family protein [Myxococcota bacterium]
MSTLIAYLFVLLGGAAGALSRFGVQELFRVFTRWPGWAAVFFVNVLGSFVICLVVAWLQGLIALEHSEGLDPLQLYIDTQDADHGLALLAAGFCGAFTTFSSFSLDNHFLAKESRALLVFNMLGSLIVCLAAVALGWSVGKAMAG